MDKPARGQLARAGRQAGPRLDHLQPSLRLIPVEDLAQMVQLHRSAFPARQVACTIYGASGVQRYLASLVAHPAYQSEHTFWGVWNGQTLLGYAHFRALPDAWHLNNIAVLPALQGGGIGRQLWQHFLRTGRERGYRHATLYVECDNLPTVAWYQRQGMQPGEKVWRYEKSLETRGADHDQAGEARLLSWDQAEAWQTAYGFSRFQVEYAGQTWEIGRLGKQYFRSSRPLPAGVEAVLHRLDPVRRLLIFSSEPLSGPEYQALGVSMRMTGALEDQT